MPWAFTGSQRFIGDSHICLWMLTCLVFTPMLATGEMTWTLCDSATTPIEAQDVQLTPDPPIIGSPATFIIKGKAGAGLDVSAGSLELRISFMGLQIWSQSEDLCTKTACPVKEGDFTATVVEALPPIAPPGEYGMEMVARDTMDNELLCLKVNFQLVYPSLAAGSKQQRQGAGALREAAYALGKRAAQKLQIQ